MSRNWIRPDKDCEISGQLSRIFGNRIASHWRSKQVGVGVVRELLGSMTAFDAKAGCVVTSGRFTTDAERFAASRGIELLDGEALRSLARSTLPLSCSAATLSLEAPKIDESSADAGASVLSPACPVCARTMIERTARTRPNGRFEVLGMSSVPGCRGTRRS